jgi:hypothetical protein
VVVWDSAAVLQSAPLVDPEDPCALLRITVTKKDWRAAG